jgi:hypothetical protein
MKPNSTLRYFLSLCSSSLLAISFAHADQIWDGGSLVDSNWNTAANWGLDTLPTFSNAITFVGNTRNGAVNNLTAASTIGGINLTNAGGIGQTNAFTLSGNKITLIGYSTGTWNSGLFTYLGNTLDDDSNFTFSGIDWTFDYNDDVAGANYNSDLASFTSSGRFVTMTAIPEPSAALLGGIGMLLLFRRRRI